MKRRRAMLGRSLVPGGDRAQRGQSVVELALILPVLLLVCLGVLDLGRLFIAYDSVLNAAHEGAFYAAYNPQSLPSGAVAQAAAQDPSLGLSSGNVTVTCYSGVSETTETCGSASEGDTVSVQVTYNFRPVTALIADLPGIGQSFTISATVKAGIYASAS